MKSVILFDIDRTLIDTEQWYRNNRVKMIDLFSEKYQLDGRRCYDVYYDMLKEKSSTSRVDLDKTISELCDLLDLPFDGFWEDFERIVRGENYEELVFPQVNEILSELKSKDHTLGVFSEGEVWMQKVKLKKSGLIRFFDKEHLYIYQNKLASLHKVPSPSVIYDDSKRVIVEVNRVTRKDIRAVRVDSSSGLRREDLEEVLALNEE